MRRRTKTTTYMSRRCCCYPCCRFTDGLLVLKLLVLVLLIPRTAVTPSLFCSWSWCATRKSSVLSGTASKSQSSDGPHLRRLFGRLCSTPPASSLNKHDRCYSSVPRGNTLGEVSTPFGESYSVHAHDTCHVHLMFAAESCRYWFLFVRRIIS